MATDQHVQAVAAAVAGLPEAPWPGGYPELGLCILDAIWSVNAKYKTTVIPVLDRYRAHRPQAERDDARALVRAIGSAGGPEAFAINVVKNRQRTSTRSGILKAEAVLLAAQAMIDGGAANSEALRASLSAGNYESLRDAWCSVRGQSSGVTWRYFLMLAGLDGVKPDRMVRRFLDETLGPDTKSDAQVVALINGAAKSLGLSSTTVDHRIWSAMSTRKKR